jgi:hypothetical protein
LREEYANLYQLIQNVLASHHLHAHPFKPVLIALASVFTGLYLGKNEEGLALSRLNHKNALHANLQTLVLLPHTYQAHLGFSFYNLFRNSRYLYDRTVYLAKAIEHLEPAKKNNYSVCFTLAKAYAAKQDTAQAIQHAVLACTLNRTHLNSFILLALLYSA